MNRMNPDDPDFEPEDDGPDQCDFCGSDLRPDETWPKCDDCSKDIAVLEVASRQTGADVEDADDDCVECPEPLPWRWLASTSWLQASVYGKPPPQSLAPRERTDELLENLFAAAVELMGEVPREFHWKSWSHDEPWVDRDKFIGEIVDVMHFIANMLVVLEVSDDEFEARYQDKQSENARRQKDGYTARRTRA